MLKRLELVGFKSFAEKTTFDFGDGITAIVGPNGSGKSNIIDAVRWTLGEQSAKSLRGGEMADVIFNGSTSRRGFGMAEVTMTLDNARRVLPTDAAVVQITRRVNRSGEGEYLLNQRVCRLKDIKDLLLGSGAGGDAYCIIEQGRVDVLLQASTKERRTIFEEAAGTSRFRARKTETLRKLEHVDQDLQRLRDILAEVDKQVRSVKLQAAKAQRYQEYSSRLKELRVGLGLREYHELSTKLEAEKAGLETLRAGLDERGRKALAWEAQVQALEGALATLDEKLHGHEGLLAEARAHIKAGQTTLGHETALSADLAEELGRTRARLSDCNSRLSGLGGAAARAAEALAHAEVQAEDERRRVQTLQTDLHQTIARLETLQVQVEADKAEHLERMRHAARLQNDVVGFQALVDTLTRERMRLRQKNAQASQSLAYLDVELEELTRAESGLQDRLSHSRQSLTSQREEGDRLRRLRDQTAEQIGALRQERTGLASRADVLDGLERSLEGLGTGVREVLALAGKDGDPSWQRVVIGMIADFLQVRHEYAPLIDLALGDWSQRFVVREASLLAEALSTRTHSFSGRVSFVPLNDRGGDGRAAGDGRRRNRLLDVSLLSQVRMPASATGVPAHPGVIAAADQLVTCPHPELADLPAQLLGRTLIVRDLATARAVATHTTGFRLVTLQGELLEPDGTLTVGVHRAEAGILSRKSELRELKARLESLDHRILESERDLVDLRERLITLDSKAAAQQEEIAVLAEQAADLHSRLERHRDRRQGLHEEVVLGKDELQRLEQEVTDAEKSWRQSQEQARLAEEQVLALQARLAAAEQEIRKRDQEREKRQQEHTTGKVALAQVEERLAGLRARQEQLEADLNQRLQERAQAEQALVSCKTRLADSQLAMLRASAALAHWFLQKEAAERHIAEVAKDRDRQRQERTRLAALAQGVRGEWQAQQEQVHAHELVASDLVHRRDSLAGRLSEDYQVQLAELYEQWAVGSAGGVTGQESGVSEERPARSDGETSPSLPGAEVPANAEEEIAELRRKLSRLGSVNLEALLELTELEQRSATLNAQLADLTSAKRSLEEIIGKINHDSRRLFTETFESIRTHFQELFRKLFGGGMADIIPEDDADILECGIEVVARPPGKELRSISLLSGGEKTLTAVALLLAIFRSKPSPFCILDEVDAALDDANIGRFTGVLREFLDRSQFIIVTHSKRTMASADVLYGITMQESGVSKKVAVRFEDWPEDGQPAGALTEDGAAFSGK
jgi:chromosome segregation protein